MEVAFVCRYGHQRVQDVLGEDRSLTPLELALFARALEEHIKVEFSPRQAIGVPAAGDT
jgi:hypothetical protein